MNEQELENQLKNQVPRQCKSDLWAITDPMFALQHFQLTSITKKKKKIKWL